MTAKVCKTAKRRGFSSIIRAAAAIAGLLGLILCIIFSGAVKSGVAAGVQLCLGVLIPSLFLPMTLCSFLQASGVVSLIGKRLDRAAHFLFNISGTAFAAFLIGIISGYPSGAVMSASLYRCGQLDRETAKRLCSVCVCAGPAFILLGVGDGLLHSRAAGYILLCAHIISAFLLLFISRIGVRNGKACAVVSETASADNKSYCKMGSFGLVGAVTQAVTCGANAMLGICAYTVLFSAVIAAADSFLGQTPMTVITGLCEVTNACLYFSQSHNIPMISAALGFAGLSVIAQAASAAGAVCDIKRLILYRILSAALSYAVCMLLLALFPQAVAVQNDGSTAVFRISCGTMALSCLLIASTAVFLYSLYQHSEPDLHDFF